MQSPHSYAHRRAHTMQKHVHTQKAYHSLDRDERCEREAEKGVCGGG